MAVHYRKDDATYYERKKVGNQTIELGINWLEDSDDERHSWWNVYITVFNKKKDMYKNMDKKAITGENPLKNVLVAREMFYDVEAYLLDRELVHGCYDDVTILCTWVNNRRRDAYYRVLSKMGYEWGTYYHEKCIKKTYNINDVNPDIMWWKEDENDDF